MRERINSYNYDEEQINLQSINKRKKNFDDNFQNVPAVKSGIEEIDDKLRIFYSSELGDNRVVIKLDKEKPEIYVAVKSILIDPGDKVLLPNAGDGSIGLVTSIVNPQAGFFLYENNHKKKTLAKKNISASFDFPKNISLLTEIELDKIIQNKAIDKIIFNGLNLNASSSKSLFINDINFYQNCLKLGGNFYLISKTSCGADSHQEILENIFEQKSEVVGRGNGGHKIFKVSKLKENTSQKTPTRQEINFELNNLHFNFETEEAVFSKQGLDTGTRILLKTIDLSLFNSMLDFGCGWGAIGIVAATLNKKGSVVMVDNNQRAVDVANTNINKRELGDRVHAIRTDNIKEEIADKFDLVLSNPPFHIKTEELMGLFNQIKEKMEKRASIYLVVENRFKGKFEDVLIKCFGNFQLKNQGENNYWIISAKK